MNQNWNDMSDDSDSDRHSVDNQTQQNQPVKQSTEQTNQKQQSQQKKERPTKKYLTDQELIQQIEQGKLENDKAIKIVKCKESNLHDIVKKAKLNEFKENNYFANFKNKEDLIAFIKKKIEKRYKFYLQPVYPKTKPNRDEARHEQRQKQKNRNEEERSYQNNTSRFYQWKANELYINSQTAAPKELLKSVETRKITSEFTKVRIYVNQTTIQIGYEFVKLFKEKFNWEEQTSYENSVNGLKNKKQVQIVLRQPQKKTQVVDEKPYTQGKKQQKQLERHHRDQKDQRENRKREDQHSKQDKHDSLGFSWKGNILYLQTNNVSHNDVLKSIKTNKISREFTKIRMVVNKLNIDLGFKIAETIEKQLNWGIQSKRHDLQRDLQQRKDTEIIIKEQPKKRQQYQQKEHRQRHQNQKVFQEKIDNQPTKSLGFQLKDNHLHIKTDESSVKEIIKTIQKSKVTSQYNKLRIFVPKKHLTFGYRVVDDIYDLFGFVESEKRIQAMNSVSQEALEIILNEGVKQGKQKEKKTYIQKGSETTIPSKKDLPTKKETPSKKELPSKVRQINSDSLSFFKDIEETNRSLLLQKIDQQEYSQKFKKEIANIFSKWDCWILSAQGDLIENLLKISWRLKKHSDADVQYTVSRSQNISQATVEIKMSEQNLQKKKRPKVDASIVNSFLTNA